MVSQGDLPDARDVLRKYGGYGLAEPSEEVRKRVRRERKEPEGYRAFGRRTADDSPPPLLDVRFRDGRRAGFPYAYQSAVRFDPDAGIRVEFSGETLVITGRNLRKLYEALLRRAVVFVEEAGRAEEALARPKQTVIMGLTLERAE